MLYAADERGWRCTHDCDHAADDPGENRKTTNEAAVVTILTSNFPHSVEMFHRA
jgi:hypothetical protein